MDGLAASLETIKTRVDVVEKAFATITLTVQEVEVNVQEQEEEVHIVEEPLDEPGLALIPMNLGEIYKKEQSQDKAYRKVSKVLRIMVKTAECEYLIENNGTFKKRCIMMLKCKRQFEEMRSRTAPGRPLPRIPTHRKRRLKGGPSKELGEGQLKGYKIKEERSEDLAVFPCPCVISGVPVDYSILNMWNEVNIMTISACRDFGQVEVRKLRKPAPQKKGASRRFIGIVKHVPVVFQGHVID